MRNWRKVVALMLSLALVFALAACGGDTPSSTAPASSKDESVSSAVEESTSEPASSDVSATEEPAADDEFSTPREETLYLGGRQWGKPGSMNPLTAVSNFMAMEQSDFATVVTYETLYMYNMLTNEIYPLLADGDPVWNDDKTVLTVKINADAKWSDGTAVTAADVAATFDAHVKYTSQWGADYSQYIESVTAVDELTVEFKTVSGEKYNPLKVMEYLPKMFVMQAAYLASADEKANGDANAIKEDTMFDAPFTGPYAPVFVDSDQKFVLERRDDYWGQAESLWGQLPVPKYIAHNIYSGNDTSATAFKAGEIDMNQQYVANLADFWLKENLPISTYLDDTPYHIAASMPSLHFNMSREGLDQKEVRQAIAYAIDYDQIVESAMTNQSPSFSEYPRCLFNPTEGERALIRDPEALKAYQWDNKDIARANKVLDDAGILDTDGDGIREYNGTKLAFKIQCPTGWTDWMSAVTTVAAAGPEIGIELETYFPEAAQHTEDYTTGNFDIAMWSYAGASISNPWTRFYQTFYGFGGEFPDIMNFNIGRFYNERADELLALIPVETDEEKVKEYYEELNILYLDEVPSVALLYRPALFHEVNESVWTNFPSAENNEGKDIPVPPQICTSGYGIAEIGRAHV